MTKTTKLVLLLTGLLFWAAMLFVSYKNGNVLLAAGAGILLGASLSAVLRDFGQKRKRAIRIGNPYF